MTTLASVSEKVIESNSVWVCVDARAYSTIILTLQKFFFKTQNLKRYVPSM